MTQDVVQIISIEFSIDFVDNFVDNYIDEQCLLGDTIMGVQMLVGRNMFLVSPMPAISKKLALSGPMMMRGHLK
jgi:hypothetical protein